MRNEQIAAAKDSLMGLLKDIAKDFLMKVGIGGTKVEGSMLHHLCVWCIVNRYLTSSSSQ